MDVFSIPYWGVMTILSTLAVIVACAGHALVRRLVPYRDLVKHNDVAGFTIAIIGVIYAVMLAFVVVVVWQQYNDADSRYGEEVASIADLDAYAHELPPNAAITIHAMATHYVRLMIDEEWPAMLRGNESPGAAQVLSDIQQTLVTSKPKDTRSAILLLRLMESLQRAKDDRARRLSDNQQTLPYVLWAALLVGAVITVCFGYLFGVENFRVQLAMTGSVAVLIAVSFTLLIELDFPFRRDAAISADRWIYLQHALGGSGTAASLPRSKPAADGGIHALRDLRGLALQGG
jgi:hypothetical protein